MIRSWVKVNKLSKTKYALNIKIAVTKNVNLKQLTVSISTRLYLQYQHALYYEVRQILHK